MFHDHSVCVYSCVTHHSWFVEVTLVLLMDSRRIDQWSHEGLQRDRPCILALFSSDSSSSTASVPRLRFNFFIFDNMFSLTYGASPAVLLLLLLFTTKVRQCYYFINIYSEPQTCPSSRLRVADKRLLHAYAIQWYITHNFFPAD